MSKLILNNSAAAPSTPSLGKTTITATDDGKLRVTDDQGVSRIFSPSVYGDDANDASKDTTETNGTTTYATYLTMSHTGKAGGRYRVGVTVSWNINSLSRNIQLQLVHAGTPIGILEIETKDTGSDIRNWNTGFFYVDELTDNTDIIELQFRPESGADTATIYYAGLEVWRVS
jgi:hypothetical protein